MKTTDLIPIILYQLKDGDRYGYEIIKQIEDVSNGNIIIKQPTLYSVLKKLEQSKFITSYWQDSEIGGKRHYYKLTDNGMLQLSTYPALEQLIKDALDEDIFNHELTNSESISNLSINDDVSDPSTIQQTNGISPMTITPIKIDLTSPTGLEIHDTNVEFHSTCSNIIDEKNEKPASIFDAIEPEVTKPKPVSIFDVIDSTDEAETGNTPTIAENVDNSSIIDNDNKGIDSNTIEPIVSVEPEVKTLDTKSTLTDKINTNPEAFISVEDLSSQESDVEDEDSSPIEQIKYLNYVDLSTDEKSIDRRKMVSVRIQKMALTCSTLLLMFVLTLIYCLKYSFGKIYYICAIASVLTIILYPIIMLKDISKLRLKYCTNPFRYSLFPDIFIKLSTFISLVCIVLAYNISTASNITEMLNMANFANLYAPIIFASVFVFDLVFGMILYKNYRIKK